MAPGNSPPAAGRHGQCRKRRQGAGDQSACHCRDLSALEPPASATAAWPALAPAPLTNVPAGLAIAAATRARAVAMAVAVAALAARATVTEALAALAARAPVTVAVAVLATRAPVTEAVAALGARTAVTVSPVPVLTTDGPRRGGGDRLTDVAFVLLALRSAPMPPKRADDRPDGGRPVARGDAAAGGRPVARGDAAAGGHRAACAVTGARRAV